MTSVLFEQVFISIVFALELLGTLVVVQLYGTLGPTSDNALCFELNVPILPALIFLVVARNNDNSIDKN